MSAARTAFVVGDIGMGLALSYLGVLIANADYGFGFRAVVTFLLLFGAFVAVLFALRELYRLLADVRLKKRYVHKRRTRSLPLGDSAS